MSLIGKSRESAGWLLLKDFNFIGLYMSRFLYSLIAGFIPSFLLLLYIWQKDRIRRKPIKELCRALGLGVLAVFLSKAITSLYTIEKGCTIWEMTCFSFLKTAIPEEIAKFIIFWLFVRKNKYFDDRMDGINDFCWFLKGQTLQNATRKLRVVRFGLM